MKYDLSSLKVNVREEHKPLWQFATRLCGIVGGIFATSGRIWVRIMGGVFRPGFEGESWQFAVAYSPYQVGAAQ